MKNIIVTLILMAPVSLSADILKAKISQIDVTSLGNRNYRINSTINLPENLYQYLDSATIQVPVERFLIEGNISKGKIHENDILFSQFSSDLNRNGSLADKYPVYFKNGHLFINKKRIYPYMSKNRYHGSTLFDNRYLSQVFTQNGMPVVLYDSDSRRRVISLGIGSPAHPLAIKKIPNPSLQVIIAAKVDTFREKPVFRIEGNDNYVFFTNQQMFQDQADSWVAMVWTAFPLREKNRLAENIKKTVLVKNIKPPFIVLSYINMTVSDETRLRFRGKIFRVLK